MPTHQVLELNKLYVLESTKTQQPYISTDGCCLVFPHEADARAAKEKIPDTKLDEPKFYKLNELCFLCYAAGASAIRLQIKDKVEELVLREEFAGHHPCGHGLNRVIADVKHTKERRHLAKLRQCEFIVPVKVKKDGEIRITYGVVKHQVQDLGMLYLAFSSLDEFNIWRSEHPGWEPLKTNFSGLRRIGGKSGVMVNPAGNRLILTPSMMLEAGEYLNKEKAGLIKSAPKEGEEEGT